jgi:hypothetical protein
MRQPTGSKSEYRNNNNIKLIKGTVIPVTGPEGPQGSEAAVRLSALHAGRPLPPRKKTYLNIMTKNVYY